MRDTNAYVDESAEGIPDESLKCSEVPLESSTSARRPGGADLIIVLGILWSMEILMGIIVAVWSISTNGLPDGVREFDLEPWIVVATAPVSATATILACWFFACRRYGRSFREGLYILPVSALTFWKWTFAGVASALVGGVLTVMFSTGESALADLVIRPSVTDDGKIELYYPVLALFVALAVVEEIYYRGFLFSVFRTMLGTRWAMAIIIAWFGLIHAPQLLGDLMGLPIVFAVGGLFTWLRFKYDSIWPSIACHVAYNTTLIGATIIQVELHNAHL